VSPALRPFVDNLELPAFALLDDFFLERSESDLAWVVLADLYAALTVTDPLVPLEGRRPAAVRIRRHSHPLRLTLANSGLTGRFVLAGGALFVHATENQRRALEPIATEAGAAGGEVLSFDRRPDRVGLRRRIYAAGRMADALIDRLRKEHVPFLDEALTRRRFLIGAKSIVHARAAIDRSEPTVVVGASNHGTDARALSRVAGQAGLPSVYVPHAPLLARERLRDVPFDYAAMRGSMETDWYTARGASLDRIETVGNPGIDAVSERVRPDPANPVVLALSPDGDEMIRAIVSAVGSMHGVPIIVAPHPRQDMERLRQVMNPAWTVWAGRTYDLLRTGPSAVVQHSSGVALEAMQLGIPCVELSLFDRPSCYPFMETDLVLHVTAPEFLPSALEHARQLAGEHHHRRALERWASSWCVDWGTSAAAAAWRFVRRAADRGVANEPIWDAWGELARRSAPADYALGRTGDNPAQR